VNGGPARAAVFVATSLDGFIAREDGALDWLPGIDDGEGGDHGFSAFMAGVDAMVVGRGTFDTVLSFPAWPYGRTPVIVLTHRPLPDAPETVTPMAGTPAEIARGAAERGWRRLYVDGGAVIRAFLAAGLVDRLILTRVPVLLGRGIPLFGPLDGDLRFRHVSTRAFASGLVQSEYATAEPGT
jgi:dihydrofolate reductase